LLYGGFTIVFVTNTILILQADSPIITPQNIIHIKKVREKKEWKDETKKGRKKHEKEGREEEIK
jgi:hypothetical protein